jgi:hypothetical protein
VALRPTYEASDRYELIERMRRDDPTSLRKLDPRFPRDLETIIHKLVAREPARRYGTAAALGGDLQRFLEDRPIEARPASPPERVLRWCRRNLWVATFLTAMAVGLIGSTWQAIRATASERAARLAEDTAGRERDRAETSRNRAMDSINDLLLLQGSTEKILITMDPDDRHEPLRLRPSRVREWPVSRSHRGVPGGAHDLEFPRDPFARP